MAFASGPSEGSLEPVPVNRNRGRARRRAAAEIRQGSFHRIDRALHREAGEGLLDLRHAPADPRGMQLRRRVAAVARAWPRLGKEWGLQRAAPGPFGIERQTGADLARIRASAGIIIKDQGTRPWDGRAFARSGALPYSDGAPSRPDVGASSTSISPTSGRKP